TDGEASGDPPRARLRFYASAVRAPRASSQPTTSSASLRRAASSGVVESHDDTQPMSAPPPSGYSAVANCPPWQAPQNPPVTSSAVGGLAEANSGSIRSS